MESFDVKVTELYTKKYLSVQQICDEMHISPSRVRTILEKNGIKRRSRSEAITKLNITKYGKGPFVMKEVLSSEEEKLKIAGIMLYWGEGTKNGNTVAFSNSNPKMIVVFLRFLRLICGAQDSRVKALVHIYKDHNEKELVRFWSEVTQIPEKNFYKSFNHGSKTGTYKKTSKYGTLSLRYSDKKLLQVINLWINESAKRFGNEMLL
jgi:hypothetical protein